jgi:hypothetical protein
MKTSAGFYTDAGPFRFHIPDRSSIFVMTAWPMDLYLRHEIADGLPGQYLQKPAGGRNHEKETG